MEAADILKVAEDDPTRCQCNIPGQYGQCRNQAVPGGSVCMVHGGNMQIESNQTRGIRNYQLGKLQAELERHANSPVIKSLRDEVAILRLTLESRLNRCADTYDLVVQSGPIGDLIMKIEKVVGSCHKLEGAMGQLLDKQAILQFANEIVALLNSGIKDGLTDGDIVTPAIKESLINNLANGILILVSREGARDANV